jgi:hypothetical protein
MCNCPFETADGTEQSWKFKRAAQERSNGYLQDGQGPSLGEFSGP